MGRIMNHIAKELVISHGFEFFDQVSFLSVALLQQMWWDNKDGYVTGDIHHHERHRPKAHNSTFPLLGDKGYLSKVKAQLLFRHICGNTASTASSGRARAERPRTRGESS